MCEMRHKVIILAEIIRFEFSFYHTEVKEPRLAHRWRENSWIHTFPENVSAMGNENNLVQDLNSGHPFLLPSPTMNAYVHRYWYIDRYERTDRDGQTDTNKDRSIER